MEINAIKHLSLCIYSIFVVIFITACGDNSGASATSSGSGADTKSDTKPLATVYKSATCTCCNKWVDHLKENGFRVVAKDVEDVNIYKKKFGVTPNLASCHTAIINGYVVEGHVPASDIKRMLKEKPAFKGLAVPGMPVGSPGMEQGNIKQPYKVMSFDKDGNKEVFSHH